MEKKFITEQVEMVEKYLEVLKEVESLVDEDGEPKRGFKARAKEARMVSRELGKTLVGFRKAFSADAE